MWNLLWCHWSIIYSDTCSVWLYCPFQHRTKQKALFHQVLAITLGKHKNQLPDDLFNWKHSRECIQKCNIVSVFYKVIVALQKKRIYLATWNQVSFAVQMNTKCLDINQNLKNSFLTDPLQSNLWFLAENLMKRERGTDRTWKTCICISKFPIKTELRLILGDNICTGFQSVDFFTPIQSIHLFTSLSSGRTTLLFTGTIY